MMKKQNLSGFTLIELLVVVAIIAVLVALLLPALGEARDKARIVSCAAQEKQLGMAIVAYANVNNSYIQVVDGEQPYEWGYRYNNTPYFKSFLRDGGITNLDLFYCPSNPMLDRRKPGDVYLFYDKPSVGYSFITYRKTHEPWVDYWRILNKPLNKIDKGYNDDTPPYNSLLAVDYGLTAEDPSIFAGANHPGRGGDWMKGANHLYGDGHVQWWEKWSPHPYWGWQWVPLYHLLWDPN